MAVIGLTTFKGRIGAGAITGVPFVLAGDTFTDLVNVTTGLASGAFYLRAPADGVVVQVDTGDNSASVFVALLSR
jgi:hypothetical protein